jgi:hypothetical protein
MMPINTRCHESSSADSYFVSIAETLADAIGVCPCEENLHLDQYIDGDHLDDAYQESGSKYNTTSINFNYGGYHVCCCFCGTITIFADREEYVNGTVALPDSMHNIRQQKHQDKSTTSKP